MDELNLDQIERSMNDAGYCALSDAKRLVACVRDYRAAQPVEPSPAPVVEAPAVEPPPATDANGSPAA